MILFTDSFDHYAIGDLTEKWTQDAANESIVSGEGRCGSDAYRNTSTNAGPSVGVVNSNSVGCVGLAYRPDSVQTLTGINIAGSNGDILITLLWNADGGFSVYLGPNAVIGTLLFTTGGGHLSVGIYTYVELEYFFNASGYIKLYINGVLNSTFNGDTTNFPLSGGYNPTLPWTLIHIFPRGYMDDVYILNGDNSDGAGKTTALGDTHIEALVAVPDSTEAGTHAEFTPSSGMDHGAMVDDNPPDGDTTYNESSTPGNRDTYKYPDLSNVISGVIHGINILLNARKSDDISTRSISTLMVIGGTDYQGSNQAISSSYKYWNQIYSINPDTSAAFTIAEVNDIDAGIEDAA